MKLNQPHRVLPRIFSGRRRARLARLVANGVAQGALLLVLAGLTRAALGAGSVDPTTGLGFVAAALALWALRIGEAGDAEFVGQDYVTRVRLRIVSTLGGASDPERHRFGTTMARVISDLNALKLWVSLGVARALGATVQLLAVVAGLLWLDPLLAAVAVATIAASLVCAAVCAPPLRDRIRDARRQRGRLANQLGERVLGPATLRLLGDADSFRRKVRIRSNRLRTALVQRAQCAQVMRSLPAVTLPLGLGALALFSSGADGGAGRLAAGALVLGLISTALGDLARALEYRLVFREGERRLLALLRTPRLRGVKTGQELPRRGPASIEWRGVQLGAGRARLDFAVAAGEVVALCGRAGSGKSRLLRLAVRLADPTAGEIRVDGVPTVQVRSDALCRAVQLVSPEIPLLRGTVASNLGTADTPPQWLQQVAKACALDRPTGALPEGLATPVEEAGRNLSAATRARIALARAAALRPRALLLDDPAFLLDPAARCAVARLREELDVTLVFVGPPAHAPVPDPRVWCLDDTLGCRRPGAGDPAPAAEESAVAQGGGVPSAASGDAPSISISSSLRCR